MKCSPKFRQVATSGAKRGHAMGRPTCESSLLELPNAKLFVKSGGVKKSALDAESRMHFANAGFSITCTMGTVRTRRGMLLSYLGTRTQTPSSSPDPFSCYKMQRRTHEICKVRPKILSHYRGSPHRGCPFSVQFRRDNRLQTLYNPRHARTRIHKPGREE
jgi:hypothetical protein